MKRCSTVVPSAGTTRTDLWTKALHSVRACYSYIQRGVFDLDLRFMIPSREPALPLKSSVLYARNSFKAMDTKKIVEIVQDLQIALGDGFGPEKSRKKFCPTSPLIVSRMN